MLVAFDLCTVSISLGVTHWLRGLYTDAVTVNRAWGERLDAYSDLGISAISVNAPGNDVFDSHDPDGEQQRKNAAFAEFGARMTQLRADLASGAVSPADAALIEGPLNRVEAYMAAMSSAADDVLDAFSRNPSEAARNMAAMDRNYGEVVESLTELRREVGTIQRRYFTEQKAAAGRVMYLEYTIASLVVMMVSAATVYGHKMAKRVDAATAAEARAEQLDAERSLLEAHQAELDHLAHHDPLSQLPNRRRFLAELGHLLEGDGAPPGARLAVLFIDVDNFKLVNDGIGHHAGDALIVTIGRRLRACARSGDLVARLGGDEFTVLIPLLEDTSAAVRLAQAVIAKLSEPVSLDGHEVRVGASVGIAMATVGVDAADEVVRRADLAMYEAKSKGKGRWELFADDLTTQVADRLAIETELRRAIDDAALPLRYDAVVDLATSQIAGFVADLCWASEQRGEISLREAAALAHDAGIAVHFARFVVTEATRQLAAWRERSGRPLFVSVDAEAFGLGADDLVAAVARGLEGAGPAYEPGLLRVALTDRAVDAQPDAVGAVVERLAGLGVGVTLVATGPSCGHHLNWLAVDDVALAPSVAEGLAQDDALATSVVANVTVRARDLGLAVIAGGLKNEAHTVAARRVGCRFASGPAWGAPLSATAAEAKVFGPTALV